MCVNTLALALMLAGVVTLAGIVQNHNGAGVAVSLQKVLDITDEGIQSIAHGSHWLNTEVVHSHMFSSAIHVRNETAISRAEYDRLLQVQMLHANNCSVDLASWGDDTDALSTCGMPASNFGEELIGALPSAREMCALTIMQLFELYNDYQLSVNHAIRLIENNALTSKVMQVKQSRTSRRVIETALRASRGEYEWTGLSVRTCDALFNTSVLSRTESDIWRVRWLNASQFVTAMAVYSLTTPHIMSQSITSPTHTLGVNGFTRTVPAQANCLLVIGSEAHSHLPVALFALQGTLSREASLLRQNVDVSIESDFTSALMWAETLLTAARVDGKETVALLFVEIAQPEQLVEVMELVSRVTAEVQPVVSTILLSGAATDTLHDLIDTQYRHKVSLFDPSTVDVTWRARGLAYGMARTFRSLAATSSLGGYATPGVSSIHGHARGMTLVAAFSAHPVSARFNPHERSNTAALNVQQANPVMRKRIAAGPRRLTRVHRGERMRSDSMLPQSFSLRANLLFAQCVPDIIDQGECGSCWAIALTNAVEIDACMHGVSQHGASWKKTQLSAQHTLSCVLPQEFGCLGGYIPQAVDALNRVGFVDSKCQGYVNGDRDSLHSHPTTGAPVRGVLPVAQCDSFCFETHARSDLSRPKIQLAELVDVTAQGHNQEYTIGIIKDYVSGKGHVLAAMTIYDDMFDYTDGLYCPGIEASVVGYHAITIVGYDTDTDGTAFWEVLNTWGRDWGLSGFMKIGMLCSDVGMDAYDVQLTQYAQLA